MVVFQYNAYQDQKEWNDCGKIVDAVMQPPSRIQFQPYLCFIELAPLIHSLKKLSRRLRTFSLHGTATHYHLASHGKSNA